MTTTGIRVAAAPAAHAVAPCSPVAPRLLAEAAALVGAACLVLHLLTAIGTHPQDVVLTAVVLGMAIACAPCLRALWGGPTRRDWAITGAMYAAMLATHVVWLGVDPASAAHSHGSGELTWAELGMWGGLLLAGLQLVLAGVGLTLARKRNRA